MIFSWLQTSTNISHFPIKVLVPTIGLISKNGISSKLVRNDHGPNFERICTPRKFRLTYEKYIKTTVLSIIKFFSLRTVNKYCECLFIMKN